MYALTNSTVILRTTDGATIPADSTNVDYQEYLSWLAAGGIPTPYVMPPPVIPTAVTMRQARYALLADGSLATVDSIIAGMTGVAGDQARIAWATSREVLRDNPVLVSILPLLGKTSAQIDALFLAASTM